MNRIIVFRILKYLLNIAGLWWMSMAAWLGYGLIVRFPTRERVMSVIGHIVLECIIIYAIYFLIALGVNFVLERYLEKRNTSREYIFLSVAQLGLLLLILALCSWEFYSLCRESS